MAAGPVVAPSRDNAITGRERFLGGETAGGVGEDRLQWGGQLRTALGAGTVGAGRGGLEDAVVGRQGKRRTKVVSVPGPVEPVDDSECVLVCIECRHEHPRAVRAGRRSEPSLVAATYGWQLPRA